MTPLNTVRTGLWTIAFSGIVNAPAGCGSDFTCVDDRTCPSARVPDGGGKAGSSGAGGSAGAGGNGAAGTDSGASLDSGGSQDSGGSTADAGFDSSPDAASDAATCETEKPTSALGLFVATAGSDIPDSGTCGSLAAPCATIKKALSLAVAGRTLYVAKGVYEEDGLSLKAGVTVQGGWDRTAQGSWQRVCGAGREAAVTIRAKSADRTLSAADLGGKATVETLTVASKTAAPASGQSLYGIFATGASTEVGLREVAVEVGPAGNGALGAVGAAGAAPLTNCSAGSGKNAASAGSAGAGAPSGTFGVSGYAAVLGVLGGPGGDGANGTAAPPAPCRACEDLDFGDSCGEECVSGTNPCSRYECRALTKEVCGFAGTNGCGGGGGKGGGAGGGGGSSIGIFAWNATFSVSAGKISAGRGGNGATGALGGPGVKGSAGGVTNFERSCPACASSIPGAPTCNTVNGTVPNGVPGGTGGAGKDGGPGGGGSGGHSYAIYKGGTAVVTLAPGVDLTAGLPGTGMGTPPGRGADGVAKPIGP